MKQQTRTLKNTRGQWETRTEIMLNDLYQLTILTMKRSSGYVLTTASVGKLDGGFITHAMYQDFSETLDKQMYSRVTAKVIEEQHFKTDFSDVIQRAKEFYSLE